MGIRGLTTYVEERKNVLLPQAKFSKQVFVIDGNSLYYFLYEENKLDVRHGGDYGKFRDLILFFFENLRRCCIQSLILFDGAFDVNKRATQLHRLQNYVEYLPDVMSQRDRKLIIPLLAGEAFQQTLEELDIPFVYALQDADRDVASIANQLNAFVLSNDSDFYVLPLTCGYIPLKHLMWDEVISHGTTCFMRGRLYKAAKFSELSNLQPSHFAFLAVLMGCDWVRAEVFFEFTNKLMQYRRNRGRWERKQSRIESVFAFLSSHRSDAPILVELANYLNSEEKFSAVKWCVDFYRNLPPSLESQSVLKDKLQSSISKATSSQAKVALEKCFKELKTVSSSEDQLVTLTRSGTFPISMLNLGQGTIAVLLPVVVGQPCQKSPHRCSYDVRASAYRLMRVERAAECDRCRLKYEKIVPPKTITRCACGTGYEMMTSPSQFTNGTSAQLKSSRKYILEALLGCDVINGRRHEEFERFSTSNRDLEFFLAVFLAWILKAKPPPTVACAVALALCDARSEFEDRMISEFVGNSHDVMDSSLVNHISEWQSCLKYALVLNRMLSCPLRDPAILYNCTTIAKVFCSLSKLKDGVVFKVADKLNAIPQMKCRFEELSTVIYRCTDQRAFQSFVKVDSHVREAVMELRSSRGRNRRKKKSVMT